MKSRRLFTYLGIFTIAFLLGCFVTYAYHFDDTKKVVNAIVPLRQNNFNYKFIYPLLMYDLSAARPFLEDTMLSQKLATYVKTQTQTSNTDSISIYYRNLLNNQWAGVDAATQYHPGSMMKVAVMIGCFRMAEADPSFMKKSLAYTDEIHQKVTDIGLASPSSLVVGKKYTIGALLEKTIQDSDNGADLLLLQNIDYKIFNDILIDLNLSTSDKDPNYTISARQYAALLRVLYNATYLDDKDSEQALAIMSQATYHDGIYAGVPAGVAVAQKYGESIQKDAAGGDIMELANCGIVYVKNSYELCVMTKTQPSSPSDEKRVASIIKDISKIVYDYTTTSTVSPRK